MLDEMVKKAKENKEKENSLNETKPGEKKEL